MLTGAHQWIRLNKACDESHHRSSSSLHLSAVHSRGEDAPPSKTFQTGWLLVLAAVTPHLAAGSMLLLLCHASVDNSPREFCSFFVRLLLVFALLANSPPLPFFEFTQEISLTANQMDSCRARRVPPPLEGWSLLKETTSCCLCCQSEPGHKQNLSQPLLEDQTDTMTTYQYSEYGRLGSDLDECPVRTDSKTQPKLLSYVQAPGRKGCHVITKGLYFLSSRPHPRIPLLLCGQLGEGWT